MAQQSTLSLQPGQSLHLLARRGMQLVALHGTCDIIGPAEWLAEQMVSSRTTLHEGEAHAIDRDGAVIIASHGHVELLCVPAARPAALPIRWVGSLAASIRRKFAMAAHQQA